MLPCRKKEITAWWHGPKGGYFWGSSPDGKDYSRLSPWASSAHSLPFSAGLTYTFLHLLPPAYAAHGFFRHRWEMTYSTARSDSSPSELAQKMQHECEKPLFAG